MSNGIEQEVPNEDGARRLAKKAAEWRVSEAVRKQIAAGGVYEGLSPSVRGVVCRG